MDHMFDTVITNYIALWRGDWGTINQIYMFAYHTMFLPMMGYLAYRMIVGVWNQRKTDKK